MRDGFKAWTVQACPHCGSTDLGHFGTEDDDSAEFGVACEGCGWGRTPEAETPPRHQRPRIAEGDEFIGAGDEVVILFTGQRGWLMDVAEDGEALVRLAADRSVTTCRFIDVAHPDSEAATRTTCVGCGDAIEAGRGSCGCSCATCGNADTGQPEPCCR